MMYRTLTTLLLAAGASQITSFIAAERIPQYAFMFIVTGVAITCQLAGIGGAALLSPIFLLVFPLLGPDYPLQQPRRPLPARS
jgi:hypothetical protein